MSDEEYEWVAAVDSDVRRAELDVERLREVLWEVVSDLHQHQLISLDRTSSLFKMLEAG